MRTLLTIPIRNLDEFIEFLETYLKFLLGSVSREGLKFTFSGGSIELAIVGDFETEEGKGVYVKVLYSGLAQHERKALENAVRHFLRMRL